MLITMRRVFALLFVLVLIAVASPTAMAGKVHPATGNNPGFSYLGSWDGWVDDHCNGSQVWQVVINYDINYNGWHTKICSNQPNFCDTPLSGNPYAEAYCIGPYVFAAANDSVSSISWRGFNGPVCIVLHSDSDYTGYKLKMGPSSTGAYTNLGNTTIGNDTASSINATSLDKC